MSRSCKTVALCADVKAAKCEYGVSMVKDALLEIAVLNVAVKVADVEVATHEDAGTNRCHCDGGDVSR